LAIFNTIFWKIGSDLLFWATLYVYRLLYPNSLSYLTSLKIQYSRSFGKTSLFTN